MEYIIRNCNELDLPELIELCAKHSAYEQAIYDTTGKEEKLKKAIFTDKKLYCSVIESEHKLQGYFSYTFDFSTWEGENFLYLDCLYLEPEFRGQRIGDIVFQKLKEIAVNNDCANIQWQTPIFNESAIRFYNRIGGISKEKVRYVMGAK